MSDVFKSRIALVYVLFDRAVDGKTQISLDEMADVFRLALDQYQPETNIMKIKTGLCGVLYEHEYFIGDSIELWMENNRCQD